MKPGRLFDVISMVFFFSQWVYNQPPIQFIEAEAGQYKQMSLIAQPSASGGEYLSMKDAGQIIWNIPVIKNDYYNITICYRAIGGDKEQYLIKNG